MRIKSGPGLGAVLFFLLLGPAVSAAAGVPLELTVFHVNDTHSHMEEMGGSLKIKGVKTYLNLGGAARMAEKLNRVRAGGGHVLFLHAGDATQGTLYFTKYRGEVEMKLLNSLSCDAMVVGNHEFDQGPEGTARLISLAGFPILGANLDAAQDKNLNGRIKPYVIREIGGAKVGLIGLVTPRTRDISSPGDRIVFLDVERTARKCVAELEAAGVNKIILLTHLGYEADKTLAARVKGIDLIVGGHSHTLLGDKAALARVGLVPQGEYPTTVPGPAGEPVFIVQSWEWAKAVGILQVSFNGQGVITQARGNAVLLVGGPFRQKDKTGKKAAVDEKTLGEIMEYLVSGKAAEQVPPDPRTLALLKPYHDEVADLQKEVVARVAEDLLHVRQPGPHPSGAILRHGSQVAPLVARSMLAKAAAVGLKPDLALQNAGGIRTDLLSGSLTVGQVQTLLPFANTLYLLELTGKEIREALNHGVARSGGAFPYLAGAEYVLDPAQPEGERVVRIELSGPDGSWKPLEDRTVYRVVTNSFLAGGGDGYAVFKNTPGKRYDTGFVDALVFMDFVRGRELRRPGRTGIWFRGENRK